MIYLNECRCSGKQHESGGWNGKHGGGRGDGKDGRDGRRRKMLNAMELSLLLLHLMEIQPRHGYDIIREFEALTGGAYLPSPGIIYPTLNLMEEAGEIEALPSAGVKRLFGITAAGLNRLHIHKDEVATVLARIEALRSTANQIDSGPVGRAMQNLSAVLKQSMLSTKDKQALFDIADLIDEAAKKIERLQ